MKRKVILEPDADRDIEDEFNYLSDRSIDAALRFLKATEDTFDDLSERQRVVCPLPCGSISNKGAKQRL